MNGMTTSIGARTLAAAALFTMAGAVHAGEATLSLGSIGAAPGATASVPVALSTDDLVGGFDFTVLASDLEVSGIDYTGPLFSNGWDGWDTAPDAAPRVSAACIFSQDQVSGSGILLLHIEVAVPADATPGDTIEVSLAEPLVFDYTFVPYDVTIVPGSVIVSGGACAEDLTADGMVDFDDLVQVLGGWGATCATPCDADVNADAEVGFTDLALVLGAWGSCGG